jgi:thioredoxin reductase (NADPH)
MLDKAAPGGQLNETTEVENYPGFAEPIQGPELMARMTEQAERFGLEIKMQEVVDIEFCKDPKGIHIIHTDEDIIGAKTIIVATGAHAVHLSAEGAERLAGHGVSYCATCDGFFFQGKNLLMVGVGDSGLTEAQFLTRYADEVRLAVRHPKDDPLAIRAKDKMLRDEVLNNPKIKVLWNVIVDEILGQEHVEGVVLKQLDTGELVTHEDIEGVFVAIGHRPSTRFVKGKLDMDDNGYLITDLRMRTKVPGVYAVGDVRQFSGSYAQAAIAVGDGCIAALEVQKYLGNGKWLEDQLSRQVLHLASLTPSGGH